MVTCSKCNSINVKVSSMDFATAKPEGMPADKHTLNKFSFWCYECNNTWISDPQSQRDYLDYVWLRDRTTMVVRDMGKDGSYHPSSIIDSGELMRCDELAKKIISSYKHMLDLPPEEWLSIEEDAR